MREKRERRGGLGILPANITAGTRNKCAIHVDCVPVCWVGAACTQKRHIGNDMVQIIWSEHSCDYRPAMITSQFNHVHIVVYPLPTGLFRVQVHRKRDVCCAFPPNPSSCLGKSLSIQEPFVELFR